MDDRAGMHLQGVITDRDIAVRHVAAGHHHVCRVRDHMTTGTIDVARPDADVHDVMGRMAHDQLRRLPAIDDGHRLVGIVSQADLARYVGPAEPMAVEHVLQAVSQPAP